MVTSAATKQAMLKAVGFDSHSVQVLFVIETCLTSLNIEYNHACTIYKCKNGNVDKKSSDLISVKMIIEH